MSSGRVCKAIETTSPLSSQEEDLYSSSEKKVKTKERVDDVTTMEEDPKNSYKEKRLGHERSIKDKNIGMEEIKDEDLSKSRWYKHHEEEKVKSDSQVVITLILEGWEPNHPCHSIVEEGTMGEHVVLSVVDPLLMAPATLQPQHGGGARVSLIEAATHVNDVGKCDTLKGEEEEEEDLIQMVECRICQEDDTLQNLDIPCACSGTLKFAHPRCVQLWCYEKGDTICEICHQPFKPGYTATSPAYHPGDTSIDISDDWAASSNPLDMHDPRLLAIAAVEHQVPETNHEDYVYTGTGGMTLWHSVGLILMALLLLRHAAPLFNTDVEKVVTYFYFFFLRAAAVILPFYLMARIICIIQHQRQRQQAAEELPFMLQAEEQQVG
ncbi:E3 ubiquitin ligase SUD1 [Spatholobus suberectus]|nr:E3 ubiquitin ligase SUD1 [Spatholobus suberectus]